MHQKPRVSIAQSTMLSTLNQLQVMCKMFIELYRYQLYMNRLN